MALPPVAALNSTIPATSTEGHSSVDVDVRESVPMRRQKMPKVRGGAVRKPEDRRVRTLGGLENEDIVVGPLVIEINSSKELPDSNSNSVRIKEERPDEDEIVQLAAKMVEANKAKMAAQAAVAAATPATRPAVPNQGILGYVSRPNSRTTPTSPAPATTPTPEAIEKPPMDQASQKGKFGWVMMGEEHLPYIQRGEDAYCSVRMVEMKLLVKYLSYLNADIYTCTCIRSYFITEPEARLLTEINMKHCEGKFGRDAFTTKDLVVRKEDASEFYSFLELCYNKLVNPSTSTDSRCGFVKINNDSVVPYTVKDGERYVPLFYFEGETETLKKRSTTLGAWDLAYLKFCCKVQGIRSELFANDSCQVISLTDIKAYFPPGTRFEEFWPPKPTDTALLVTNKTSGTRGVPPASWIKVPHGSSPPATSIEPLIPAANPVTNGWSAAAMMNSAVRYPSSSLPATTQPRSNPIVYSNVANTNNQIGTRNYNNRVSSTNYNFTGVPHAGHNSIPSMPTSPSAQVPPPLVRVTSANPTLSKSAYSCTPAATTYTSTPTTVPHSSSEIFLSNGLLPPPPHLQYAASHNNNNNPAQKYPSLHHVNGSSSRYYGSSPDVIDLSSPPHSPQRNLLMNGKQTPQPAHQTSRPSPTQAKSPPNPGGWTRLVPIPETPARQSNHTPFKMQKALVSGKMVPCINAKPYVYSELLMTVIDLLDYFFPGVSIEKCREVLQNVLQVTLYSGNLAQKSVLRENNKCKTLTEILPLIQLKDVMQYMPQLKYIMERHMANLGGESAPKRTRLS